MKGSYTGMSGNFFYLINQKKNVQPLGNKNWPDGGQ
jgi:hypothetical protein